MLSNHCACGWQICRPSQEKANLSNSNWKKANHFQKSVVLPATDLDNYGAPQLDRAPESLALPSPAPHSNWTLPPQEAQDEKRVLPLLGGLILLPRCRRLLRSSGVGCNDVNEFNITLGNYQRPNHSRPNQCKSRENASAAPVGVPGMREVLWTRGTKCPVSRGCWTAKMQQQISQIKVPVVNLDNQEKGENFTPSTFANSLI